MRFLPKTRTERVRLLVLGAIFIGLFVPFIALPLLRIVKYQPKEGDIVFQSLPKADLVDAIEGVTNSDLSHCGVMMKRGEEWVVVEAIGKVSETPFWKWAVRGRDRCFEVYRLKDTTNLDIPKLQSGLSEFLGRPYDFHYAMGETEIYCSELVYKAYDRSHGIKIGEIETLGSLNWRPFEAFIRDMQEGELPLDREMITPVSLTRSPLLTRIVSK